MSDHFYTTSAAERDSATAAAYESEGVAGFVFRDPEPGPVPLYRAFNPSNGDHFYTANEVEYTNAVNNYDYLAEGTAGFLHTAPASGTIPFFRLLLPNTGDHFYTTSVAERDSAIANSGYLDEGIVGYVWASATMGTAPLYRSFNARAPA